MRLAADRQQRVVHPVVAAARRHGMCTQPAAAVSKQVLQVSPPAGLRPAHHQLRSILSTIHRTCPWPPPPPPPPLLLGLLPCCRSGGRRPHISSAYFLPTAAMRAASTLPCSRASPSAVNR